MNNKILAIQWEQYKNYVKSVLLPAADEGARDIAYWRNELFFNLIIYLLPICFIALVPSIFMSFKNEIPIVAVADLIGFFSLMVISLHRPLTVRLRKIIFICSAYIISVALLYYLSVSGAGMLFMLAVSVITCIIYSYSAAYYTVLASTIICFVFGLLIFLGYVHIASVNQVGTWAAISANVIFLSLICIESMKMLLNGLETNMAEKLTYAKEKDILANRLLLATRSAGMGIWEWDITRDHLSLDDGMLHLYDLNALQFGTVYGGWLSRLHPEDKDRTNNDIQNAIIGIKEYNTEFRIVWSDLSVRYIRATGTVLRDDKGNALRMIGVNWDVTDKKLEEEKLIVSEANLTAIIESADANIYSLDKDFRYITFNQMLRKTVKHIYNVDIKTGDNLIDFLEKIAPLEAYEWSRIYTEALAGKTLKFEREFDTGGSVSTASFSIHPIIKADTVIGLSCFAADVTDMKKIQLEIQQLNTSLELKVKERTAELENANKELEAFSYSVSHDLRAPVRAVMSFTKLITDQHADSFDEDAKELFSYIEKNSKRMNAIIDDLLVLAKYGKEKLVYSDVDLSKLFTDVWDNILLTSPHQAKLEMDQMPTVHADRSMLQQVIVNMVSNAVKYSSKKDKPVITVGYTKTDESFTISVKDNGAGFNMKHYDRLFGAFQRLHGESEFEGTGVGLMLTKKIIDRHGGTVWAEGKVDEGATFYFSLPLAA